MNEENTPSKDRILGSIPHSTPATPAMSGGDFGDDGSSPVALLTEPIDEAMVHRFRDRTFSNVKQMERLRDWLHSPMAQGVQRGLALWALGQHKGAVQILEEHQDNPALADCLARSYTALGRLDEAEAVLKGRTTNPAQAATYLACRERRGDSKLLRGALDEVKSILSPADTRYFEGRIKEMERDPEGAIACYDEALALHENHRDALFRLALNVDLRGEDEEARELYERALMVPPVNEACVVNLGILYEDMGNYRRAMQCFDLALQANPDNRRARMYRRDAAAALNMYYDEEQERREDKRNKILRTPINDFELSVRSRNCLANMNIRTLGDLVKKTEAELLSYKNFGETSLTEIKEILRNKSLRLGMNQDELMSKELGTQAAEQVPLEEMPDPNSPDPAKRPVTELDLSVRCRRIVDILKIKTIGDLANKSEAELLACPNFGQTSLNEIRTKLDELGLALRS
jgi:DNA-directed RNA polymerase subunit alpha